MAGTQAGLNALCQDTQSFQGTLKRPNHERPNHERPEDAPIKKRVMAKMNLKCRHLEVLPKTLKIKKERMEEEEGEKEEQRETRERLWSEQTDDRNMKQFPVPSGGGALDLSPGLKHTLAQFTLSSQSSLGGPAAFSARGAQDVHAPLSSPPVLGGGPLLVPCDSSTELIHSLLEGESISSFMVGGEKRLCLPQVLNSVLRQFSLQQINGVCDELYVYCSRCDAEQLHVLKVLGILPFNAPSCGLITLTDAQRLCNALLRPGALPLPQDPGGGSAKLREGEASFRVEHQCLGKCQGVFATQLYTHPDAPCIQCVQCHLLFAPQRFVMHSHRSPDKRTCHWGFDSARWARYLQLGRTHLGTPREAELKQLLEEVKEKFHCAPRRAPLDRKDDVDDRPLKSLSDVCSQSEKLCESELDRKLYPDVKEESGHAASLLHPSCLLYMYDKIGTPDLSQAPPLSVEVLGALYKHHHNGHKRGLSQDQEEAGLMSAPVSDLHTTCRSATAGAKSTAWPATMETPPGEDGCTKPLSEEDKDRMVLDVLQMYCRQQEVLHSTLQKHRQLEMEVEALRKGDAAAQRELQKKPTKIYTEHAQEKKQHAEHAQEKEHTEHSQNKEEEHTEHSQNKEEECTEHAQEKEEARTEHAQDKKEERTEHAQEKEEEHTEHALENEEDRTEHAQNKEEEPTEHAQEKVEERTEHAHSQDESELESKLGDVRQQTCTCKLSMEQCQDAHYTSQLLELRRRLDQAEEDREELQEELCREREAREKLELMISQLRQLGGAPCSCPRPRN